MTFLALSSSSVRADVTPPSVSAPAPKSWREGCAAGIDAAVRREKLLHGADVTAFARVEIWAPAVGMASVKPRLGARKTTTTWQTESGAFHRWFHRSQSGASAFIGPERGSRFDKILRPVVDQCLADAAEAAPSFSPAKLAQLLGAVQNSRIRFATARPRQVPFGRDVLLEGPAEVIELAAGADRSVVLGLLDLLQDRNTAWAAEVVLVAIDGDPLDGRIVDTYATTPDQWWNIFGGTAKQHWQENFERN